MIRGSVCDASNAPSSGDVRSAATTRSVQETASGDYAPKPNLSSSLDSKTGNTGHKKPGLDDFGRSSKPEITTKSLINSRHFPLSYNTPTSPMLNAVPNPFMSTRTDYPDRVLFADNRQGVDTTSSRFRMGEQTTEKTSLAYATFAMQKSILGLARTGASSRPTLNGNSSQPPAQSAGPINPPGPAHIRQAPPRRRTARGTGLLLRRSTPRPKR